MDTCPTDLVEHLPSEYHQIVDAASLGERLDPSIELLKTRVWWSHWMHGTHPVKAQRTSQTIVCAAKRPRQFVQGLSYAPLVPTGLDESGDCAQFSRLPSLKVGHDPNVMAYPPF